MVAVQPGPLVHAPRSRVAALAHRVAALPLLAQVAGVYAFSRVVSTVLFLVVDQVGSAHSEPGVGTGLLAHLTAWDGGWFQRIGTAQGYPAAIPTVGGLVEPNAWAFLPLYPMTVKVLALGSAAAWPVVAVAVSTVCGLIATLLLALLVRRHADRLHTLAAVVVFALGPVASILQTAYAESMGLMLLFLLLSQVDRRQYGTAALVAVPLAFARPGMQAVALALGLILLGRFVGARRGGGALPAAEVVRIVGLSAFSAALGFAWPAVAAVVTGRPDAYVATEVSWRAGYSGSDALQPFHGWPLAFEVGFGRVGLILLALLAGAVAAMFLLRRVRALQGTIWSFGVAWVVYLLAVFFPQSSTLRMLLPAAPLGAALPVRSPIGLAVLAALCIAAQWLWMLHGYGTPASFWTAP